MQATLTAAERPLGIRCREDLRAERIKTRKGEYWNVKDPLSLRIYQLGNEEFYVLQLLDGKRRLNEIASLVEQRFAPRKMHVRHLQAFIGMLHREGLTIADADGQGQELLSRHDERRRTQLLSALSNPLACRFPGINPTRFFDWLYKNLAWCFRPTALICALLLCVSAAVLLLTHIDGVLARLREASSLFSPSNLFAFTLSVILVKVLHEFGHGLTCRHFGGTCHELGIMLLVGIPCLYCNVSDAWMLNGKWKRVAISLAGILVELVIAAVCTFLWWFSEPGLLRTVCLNLMIICSVSTLFLNGNPLLRFDGYYVLADLLEIPNLHQCSAQRVQRIFSRAFLGLRSDPRDDYRGPTALFLVFYGLASLVYRWLLIIGILWVTFWFLNRQGIALLGYILIAIVFAGLIGSMGSKLFGLLRDPSRRHSIKVGRLFGAASVSLAVLLTVLFVPLPRRVKAPAILRLREAEPVFVTVPGRIKWTIKSGSKVNEGDMIAVLGNHEIENLLSEIDRRCREQRTEVEILRRRQLRSQHAGARIPAAEELLRALQAQRKERARLQEQLTLRAPRSGLVLPPRSRSSREQPNELPTWSGTPLDSRNAGTFLDADTLVCLIGDPSSLEAVVYVDQRQLPLIALEQSVAIRPWSHPELSLQGVVRNIADIQTSDPPPELVSTGQVALRDHDGSRQPVDKLYELHVELLAGNERVLIGSTGRASVGVAAAPLGHRLIRALQSAFRFVPQ